MKILHVFTLITTSRSFFDGQFKYLSEKGKHNLHLVSDSECDEDFCNRNSIEYHKILIARKIDIVSDIKSIYQLYKLIRIEKFDAVVGHTPKGAMVAMFASKLAGIRKRVYYRHGLIYTTAKGIKRVILKSVERITSSFSTHIVNVSSSLNELAVKDKLNSSIKQRIIGAGTCGGIDTKNIFNPKLLDESKLSVLRFSQGLNESEFVIGFCGRICKDKGIRELIDGFKDFRNSHSDLKPKLFLVGDYDKRDILPESYRTIIENDADIVYTGHVPKKILPYYYSLMDVFVFPSYREGFGMSVIEAGAMEVPALVSRSHGCIDSIVEGETGNYIDISPDGVCDGLEKVLNSSIREQYGHAARRYIENNYNYDVLWPQILEFYNELALK